MTIVYLQLPYVTATKKKTLTAVFSKRNMTGRKSRRISEEELDDAKQESPESSDDKDKSDFNQSSHESSSEIMPARTLRSKAGKSNKDSNEEKNSEMGDNKANSPTMSPIKIFRKRKQYDYSETKEKASKIMKKTKDGTIDMELTDLDKAKNPTPDSDSAIDVQHSTILSGGVSRNFRHSSEERELGDSSDYVEAESRDPSDNADLMEQCGISKNSKRFSRLSIEKITPKEIEKHTHSDNLIGSTGANEAELEGENLFEGDSEDVCFLDYLVDNNEKKEDDEEQGSETDNTKQENFKQSNTKQDNTEQDNAEQDITMQDNAEQDITMQDNPQNISTDADHESSKYTGLKKVYPVTKKEGKKYMILDKATIKGMMEKGLIQAINKTKKGPDGTQQQNVTYRAILPKAGPSLLYKVGTPVQIRNLTEKSEPDENKKETGSSEKPSPVKGSISTTASRPDTTKFAPSPSIKVSSSSEKIQLQIPSASGLTKTSTSGGKAVVKTSASSANIGVSSSGGVQILNLPPSLLNQLQKSLSTKFDEDVSKKKSNPSAGNVKFDDTDNDPDDPPPASGNDHVDDEKEETAPPENAKYGVPTGVCKVLKSMKMFQYIDDEKMQENSSKVSDNQAHNITNVRWVAVPKSQPDAKVDTIKKIGPAPPKEAPNKTVPITNERQLRIIMAEMKITHSRLIGKHRTRYSRLVKKFSELERDFKEVADVGTPGQLVRDCKKFLSPEHALFMESQMFWKNTPGKGNRYCKRFLYLMLDLYRKSPAGYRYLKTVFTLPSVKLLLKIENQVNRKSGKIEQESPEKKKGDMKIPMTNHSRITDDEEEIISYDLPMSTINIKTELPLAERNSLSLPVDSKGWFKPGLMLSESVPCSNEQTVFFNPSMKESLMGLRPLEGEDVNSSQNIQNLELNGDGSIMAFDTISKKFVVVQDNEGTDKQEEVTIQWDEPWELDELQ